MPVGSFWGAGCGMPSGIPGLSFGGFRVVARDGGDVLFDEVCAPDGLNALQSALPEVFKTEFDLRLATLQQPRQSLELSGLERSLAFSRPLVMGVLNVTPDSFSDGGRFLDADAAIAHARQMISEGVDVIDIGGESTRPGATPVWEGEEADRVVPVIDALKESGIPLSIDSRHAFVMDKALMAGAHIINDVSALTYDPDSLSLAANCDAPVVLMHAQGTPKTMQDAPAYDDVLLDVYDYLNERIGACEAAGIARSRLIVDPGIGFGKRVVQDNLALMNGLGLFHTLGCPLLVGASRKRFIGAITGEEQADGRLAGSLAAALKAAEAGVQILRVHDVKETAQAMKVLQAMHDSAMIGGTS